MQTMLDSALNLKYNNYEVIVVNNGSTDKTREILEDYEKDLKIINLKQNVGFANANNIAYKRSKSDFVLLLNSDAIPEQDSLNELIKVGISDNKIGALGGVQVDYKKRNVTGLGELCDIYGNWIVPKDKINIDEVKESYYSYIPASFLLVRRKSINDTLFPKEFFTFVEDVELCFRIWSRGYYVKLYPAVVCSHELRTSIKVASKRNLFLNRMLSHSYAKNSALLLSVYRKLLPKIYELKFLELILYQPIIEIIHFPRYLLHKNNYNFACAYYPSLTMTYLKYSIKKLSTINDYSNYIPLSIKLNNSKKFLFSPSKNILGRLMILDYEKMMITDDDIMRSTRKFIVTK
ncbi:MAG: glycosyltransferase [Thermoproteota archaeon]|nr:glycosyltransferase [Thermoproteota archaeon]